MITADQVNQLVAKITDLKAKVAAGVVDPAVQAELDAEKAKNVDLQAKLDASAAADAALNDPALEASVVAALA